MQITHKHDSQKLVLESNTSYLLNIPLNKIIQGKSQTLSLIIQFFFFTCQSIRESNKQKGNYTLT